MPRKKSGERNAQLREKEKQLAREFIRENGRIPFPRELDGLFGYSNAYVSLMYHGWGNTGKTAINNFYTAIGHKRPYQRRPNRLRRSKTPGTRLTRMRRGLGLSLQGLEAHIGLNYTSISEHERDRRKMGKRALTKYVEFYQQFYEVSEEWILTGKD